MTVRMIEERLAGYDCQTALEEEQALREITQEVALAALGRGDFFKHALFQGGTCLRIFHGLNRFSEDLDFTLREPDPGFRLHDHIQHLVDELATYGYAVEISDRAQAGAAVQAAFLKDNSIGRLLELRHADRSGPARKIRIKLEIDTNPPAGGGEVLEYLDFPFVASVAAQDLPTLFAGKIHALLCRRFVKGRDWYDFLWYTSRAAGMNALYLTAAIGQFGPWQGQGIKAERAWVVVELEKKISSIDWKQASDEVRPFVRSMEQPSIELWSEALFQYQLRKWARTGE